jgi:hypothetical protein
LSLRFAALSDLIVFAVCSIVCRTSADIRAFDLLIALRLDFAGLRVDARHFDVKPVCF